MNTELTCATLITGSACTKRQLHHAELLDGTTATRRRIETGRQYDTGITGMNLMSGLDASVTRRTDSGTTGARMAITTLARNMQVFVHANLSWHSVN